MNDFDEIKIVTILTTLFTEFFFFKQPKVVSRNISGKIFFVFQKMWLQCTDTTKCKLQRFLLLFRLVFL